MQLVIALLMQLPLDKFVLISLDGSDVAGNGGVETVDNTLLLSVKCSTVLTDLASSIGVIVGNTDVVAMAITRDLHYKH